MVAHITGIPDIAEDITCWFMADRSRNVERWEEAPPNMFIGDCMEDDEDPEDSGDDDDDAIARPWDMRPGRWARIFCVHSRD